MMKHAYFAEDAAEYLADCPVISLEMMYRPRPEAAPARPLFDAGLRARLDALQAGDGVVFSADGFGTIASLRELTDAYPQLKLVSMITPQHTAVSFNSEAPYAWGWDAPDAWVMAEKSDRWIRIEGGAFICSTIAGTGKEGWLVMPAHDAVYGRPLLERLKAESLRIRDAAGRPAAVSPYAPNQHAPMAGVDIDPEVIDLLNAAFARDDDMHGRISRDEVQGFWGKMSLTPYALCGELLAHASYAVWEDDKEIDRVLREAGALPRALYIDDPALYKQCPPVFTPGDVRAVIERHLHYSLNIPAEPIGTASVLCRPLNVPARARAESDPQFARAAAQADVMIAACRDEIEDRVARTGVSWVDWGAYRYVVRIGSPDVQVWRRLPTSG